MFQWFVFFEVDFGEIVIYFEEVGLLYTDAAADTAYFAKLTCGFSVFGASSGDGHHIFPAERHHFDKASGACCCACGAAGAFFVIYCA